MAARKPTPDFWDSVKLPGGSDPAYDRATRARAKQTLAAQTAAAKRAAARPKAPARGKAVDTSSTGAKGRKATLGRVLKSM